MGRTYAPLDAPKSNNNPHLFHQHMQLWLDLIYMPKCTVNEKQWLKYSERDLKYESKSNLLYNGDCLPWKKIEAK
jgi:hypothetical protein